MGAHSSLVITRSEARRIYNELVQNDPEVTYEQIESFFDMALDDALYNVVIYRDETDEKSDASTVEYYVRQYMEENPHKRPASMTEENKILRELLAIRVGGIAGLYTDDGELQDNTVHPCIDFRRDSAQEIRRKLTERGRRQLEAIQGKQE